MVYPGVFNHDADSSFCMSIQTLSWSSFRFWSICILMHAGVVLSSHARLLLPFALSCCVYSWRFSSHWSNDNLVIELRGMYGICTNLRCVPMRYCSGYKSIFFYLFNLLFLCVCVFSVLLPTTFPTHFTCSTRTTVHSCEGTAPCLAPYIYTAVTERRQQCLDASWQSSPAQWCSILHGPLHSIPC